MGVENSDFDVRVMIQRIFWPYFSLPRTIRTVFTNVVRSPRFIPSPCFIPSPYFPVRVLYTYTAFYTQSAVPSPQSVFYTDRSLSRQLQRVSTVNDNHFENWIQNNG